jgi:hypothetical protein
LKRVESICDPVDINIIYWVAWSAKDNPDCDPWAREELLHRVFRDDRREKGAQPISEAMSRDEAYKLLGQMALLFKGS